MTTLARLEELLKDLSNKVEELRKDKRPMQDHNDALNAVAAKIIKDLGEKIDACECTKKLVAELKEKAPPKIEKKTESTSTSGFQRYSYPNFQVGNAGLGSSGNPNALRWPFGEKKP